MKHYEGQEGLDEKMKPRYWKNNDAQDHYFVSYLKKKYPSFPDLYPKIIAKHDKVTLIPHGYYTVHSRDDSPINGSWIIGEQVEDVPTSALSHGDQASLTR